MEGTVGSLSFNVIDIHHLQNIVLNHQVASEDTGSLVKNSQEQKPSARNPTAQAKVPFNDYSQMDWLRLTQTHPDLAGLRGPSIKRLMSMNKVKRHQTDGSMWTVLKSHVYNLSPYMMFHPGGVDMLMTAVGKDSTSLFNILLWL